MATAAAKTETEERKLALELVELEAEHAVVFARMEDIKSKLRKIATEKGENFKEEFAGKGQVKVSGASAAKFKGIMPTINVEAFLELPEKRREKLIEDDIIAMTPTYGKPYYGSVTVELFKA